MDLRDALSKSDRRLLDRLAEAAGISPEALLPEIVSGYLRLLREAPDALPRDPLAPLRKGASA